MPQPVFIAISHGTASDEGRLAVARLFEAAVDRLPGIAVYLGHVDVQEPDVPTTLASVEEEGPAVIVPLLLSAGYHVRVDLQRAIQDHPDIVIADALGPDPRLADLLVERLGALEPGQPVVLAVAGSSDERANEDCRETARLLADRLRRQVTVGFLAAAEPRLDAAVADAAEHGEVVVANYLLAPGYFRDLAVELAGGHRVADPLLLPDAAPAASLVDLVIDRYEAASGCRGTVAGSLTGG